MSNLVIGLVGEKAAGKGTVAGYLKEHHGASVHTFSKSMKDCLERLGLEKTRDNLIKFSVATREAFGENHYARVIANDAKNDRSPLIVVDGIRREGDISELKTLANFFLVCITAPPELRWERARKRGEKPEEATQSFEDFMKEEWAPTETAVPLLGKTATVTIQNEDTLEDLYARVEGVMRDLKTPIT